MKNIQYNPCTLVPTDFQLCRKMKFKFRFRFSLCSKKNEIGLSFSFFNFPRREGNGIRIHFMLSVFLFSIALKKRILIFFFVFVWNLENGLQVVFCSTRNRRTKSLFKTSSNTAILVSLQSKYSVRSAYCSRMTFMDRERIVLFVSNFQI